MRPTVASSSGTENAAARASRGGDWKKAQVGVGMGGRPAGSPRRAGAPKSESEWRNATMKPPISAGAVSGSVIVSAIFHLFAPRMFAASSRSDEMSSETLAIIEKTYGKL